MSAKPYKDRRPLDTDRQNAMCAMYRAGLTLATIGEQYGITRERVRQIIAAAGMTRKDGGIYKTAVAKRQKRKAEAAMRRDARAILYYGCRYSELLANNDGRPVRDNASVVGRFRTQKNSARTRRVPWAITFPQWLKVWIDSGHWEDRGRHADGYVMARKDDTGPYAVGNIYITTMAQNVVDYQANLKTVGVLCPDGYKRLPQRAQRIFGEAIKSEAA